VPRIPARLALVLLLLCTGCGGGGGSTTRHEAVEAFPDVLEVARAELGEDASLLEVTFSPSAISFVHVQFGRVTRISYDPDAVFTGSTRLRTPRNLRATFPISSVPADAPKRLLAAIREREGEDVRGLSGRLARDKRGALVWLAQATVGSEQREYTAAPDGALRA
jgi:hypothetical protein